MDSPSSPAKTCRLTEFRSTLSLNGGVQVVLLMWTSGILDLGVILYHVMVACLAYWLTVLWLGVRRSKALTRGDAVMLRFGFLFYLVITLLLSHLVGNFRRFS